MKRALIVLSLLCFAGPTLASPEESEKFLRTVYEALGAEPTDCSKKTQRTNDAATFMCATFAAKAPKFRPSADALIGF